MKNAIFLAAIACLLAGCASDSKPVFKAVIQGSERQTPPLKIATEPNLPVVIKTQGNEALPVDVRTSCIAYMAMVLALLSVFFAGWAAYNTKQAAEGSLFSELIHRYDLEEMHEALKDIWNWGKPHLKSGKLEDEAKMITESRNSNKKAGKIDQARRRVTHYYLNVLQLKRLRYISKDVAIWIFEEIGVNILNVLEPLEKALIRDKNKDNQPKIDEEIKRLEKDFNEIRELAG